jgi:hypothetical protein
MSNQATFVVTSEASINIEDQDVSYEISKDQKFNAQIFYGWGYEDQKEIELNYDTDTNISVLSSTSDTKNDTTQQGSIAASNLDKTMLARRLYKALFKHTAKIDESEPSGYPPSWSFNNYTQSVFAPGSSNQAKMTAMIDDLFNTTNSDLRFSTPLQNHFFAALAKEWTTGSLTDGKSAFMTVEGLTELSEELSRFRYEDQYISNGHDHSFRMQDITEPKYYSQLPDRVVGDFVWGIMDFGGSKYLVHPNQGTLAGWPSEDYPIYTSGRRVPIVNASGNRMYWTYNSAANVGLNNIYKLSTDPGGLEAFYYSDFQSIDDVKSSRYEIENLTYYYFNGMPNIYEPSVYLKKIQTQDPTTDVFVENDFERKRFYTWSEGFSISTANFEDENVYNGHPLFYDYRPAPSDDDYDAADAPQSKIQTNTKHNVTLDNTPYPVYSRAMVELGVENMDALVESTILVKKNSAGQMIAGTAAAFVGGDEVDELLLNTPSDTKYLQLRKNQSAFEFIGTPSLIESLHKLKKIDLPSTHPELLAEYISLTVQAYVTMDTDEQYFWDVATIDYNTCTPIPHTIYKNYTELLVSVYEDVPILKELFSSNDSQLLDLNASDISFFNQYYVTKVEFANTHVQSSVLYDLLVSNGDSLYINGSIPLETYNSMDASVKTFISGYGNADGSSSSFVFAEDALDKTSIANNNPEIEEAVLNVLFSPSPLNTITFKQTINTPPIDILDLLDNNTDYKLHTSKFTFVLRSNVSWPPTDISGSPLMSGISDNLSTAITYPIKSTVTLNEFSFLWERIRASENGLEIALEPYLAGVTLQPRFDVYVSDYVYNQTYSTDFSAFFETPTDDSKLYQVPDKPPGYYISKPTDMPLLYEPNVQRPATYPDVLYLDALDNTTFYTKTKLLSDNLVPDNTKVINTTTNAEYLYTPLYHTWDIDTNIIEGQFTSTPNDYPVEYKVKDQLIFNGKKRTVKLQKHDEIRFVCSFTAEGDGTGRTYRVLFRFRNGVDVDNEGGHSGDSGPIDELVDRYGPP